MISQKFQEWYASRHMNGIYRGDLEAAWHSRDAEVAELQANLAEAERKNAVALEAMKKSLRTYGKDDAFFDAIKEIEGSKP